MAVIELSDIVGSAAILDSAEVLEDYSRDLSFVPGIRPRCVVKIQDAGQIQPLVKWANETLTPLVPISSGGPHFRGDTVPAAGGAVIVDLSGLKKNIRIDTVNRVAMVEPGLTFSELIPQLERAGLRLNLPLLPRAKKSVVGSMLVREPVMMPWYQWDSQDPLTCIEVIFGTGDLFRTGSSAGPGSLEDQWKAKQAQVNPMGPGQTDFGRVVQGAQGTLGIVTWATIRCEALPALRKAFLVGSDRYEKLADLVYRILWRRAGDECFILNDAALAAILSQNLADYEKIKGALPPWILFFCLAGFAYFPEEKVAYQEKALLSEAGRLGLQMAASLPGVSSTEIMRLVSRPAEDPHWKLRRKGAFQDLCFLTTLDRVPEFVSIMHEATLESGYPPAEIGAYVQPMVQGTSCHCEFNFFYNPASPGETARVNSLVTKSGQALLNGGAFFSRPYGALSDDIYRRDAETTAALRKVKKIFDPNNILNPGKLCF